MRQHRVTQDPVQHGRGVVEVVMRQRVVLRRIRKPSSFILIIEKTRYRGREV